MAQAARLNLRMQKELKLLMTDPPHGVSLPLLPDNDNLASPSLTSIEARIEGPEGTVYSKGVFTVKIQIPERYPFQPPNVTFATPIYHPNIDNGGRICLDILNLPPKGAWQPSLNISTVLTSIGLLLSEPNPDDGLMAEASREYKYNKQVFDQKAQSWTEMYASPGASATSNNIVHSAKQSEMEAERVEVAVKTVDENDGRRKKLHLGEKLSLKFTVPVKTNCIDEKENVEVQAEVDRAEVTLENIDGKVARRKKLQLVEKLSVESSLPAKTNCPDDKENVVDRAEGTSENVDEKVGRRKKLHLVEKFSLKSSLPAKTFCADDKENVEVQAEVDRAEVISRNIDQNEGRQKKLSLEPTIPVKPNCIDRKDNVELLCTENATSRNVDEIERRRKKLHLREKLSLKSAVPVETKCSVEKENVAPGWLTLSWSESPPTGSSSSPVAIDANNCGDKSAQKAPNGTHKQDAGPPNGIETIIVSDSEESEDESIIVSRPRFPLMRRRMLGKRKGTY